MHPGSPFPPTWEEKMKSFSEWMERVHLLASISRSMQWDFDPPHGLLHGWGSRTLLVEILTWCLRWSQHITVDGLWLVLSCLSAMMILHQFNQIPPSRSALHLLSVALRCCFVLLFCFFFEIIFVALIVRLISAPSLFLISCAIFEPRKSFGYLNHFKHSFQIAPHFSCFKSLPRRVTQHSPLHPTPNFVSLK